MCLKCIPNDLSWMRIGHGIFEYFLLFIDAGTKKTASFIYVFDFVSELPLSISFLLYHSNTYFEREIEGSESVYKMTYVCVDGIHNNNKMVPEYEQKSHRMMKYA